MRTPRDGAEVVAASQRELLGRLAGIVLAREGSSAHDCSSTTMRELASRHKLRGALCSRALETLGLDDVAIADLRDEQSRRAVRTGSLLHIAATVGGLLSAENVRHLWAKGPGTELLLNGAPESRDVSDLDLYCMQGNVIAALTVLQNCGFKAAHPSAIDEKFIANAHEVELSHENGAVIDLHWRVTQCDELSADLMQQRCSTQTQFGDIWLPSIHHAKEIAVLHALKHGFSSLRDVTDVVRLSRADASGNTAAMCSPTLLRNANRLCDAIIAEITQEQSSLTQRSRTLSLALKNLMGDSREGESVRNLMLNLRLRSIAEYPRYLLSKLRPTAGDFVDGRGAHSHRIRSLFRKIRAD